MKTLNWIGKLLVVLAAVIIIAGAVIWLVNAGWAGRALGITGTRTFGERMGEFERGRFRSFEGLPEGRQFGWRGGFDDRFGGFGDRRVAPFFGVMQIFSRLAVFGLVTAAVFLIGFVIGKGKSAKHAVLRQANPTSSTTAVQQPPDDSAAQSPPDA